MRVRNRHHCNQELNRLRRPNAGSPAKNTMQRFPCIGWMSHTAANSAKARPCDIPFVARAHKSRKSTPMRPSTCHTGAQIPQRCSCVTFDWTGIRTWFIFPQVTGLTFHARGAGAPAQCRTRPQMRKMSSYVTSPTPHRSANPEMASICGVQSGRHSRRICVSAGKWPVVSRKKAERAHSTPQKDAKAGMASICGVANTPNRYKYGNGIHLWCRQRLKQVPMPERHSNEALGCQLGYRREGISRRSRPSARR